MRVETDFFAVVEGTQGFQDLGIDKFARVGWNGREKGLERNGDVLEIGPEFFRGTGPVPGDGRLTLVYVAKTGFAERGGELVGFAELKSLVSDLGDFEFGMELADDADGGREIGLLHGSPGEEGDAAAGR